jgi:hypothetical protein
MNLLISFHSIFHDEETSRQEEEVEDAGAGVEHRGYRAGGELQLRTGGLRGGGGGGGGGA